MQSYVFELLTEPYSDDATDLSTYANVASFANARNFQLVVDARVADYFVVDGAGLSGSNYTVTMHRTSSHAGDQVRFAALVTCDTDETDPQEEPETGSSWTAAAPGQELTKIHLFVPA